MERNVTLDFVRGVAILGILLLNISAFGLPKAAYLNPAWYGAITPQDAWTWAFLDLIAQVKFLTLFALLFGAGLQMLLPRGRRWIQSRLTLLVLLGFIHGLLFWDGDILLAYGVMKLASLRLKSEGAQLFIFEIASILPTVVFNGAYWGQCDAIYTGFCLLGLYLCLTKKPCRGMIAFGVAISF